jgi:hypothetical protein
MNNVLTDNNLSFKGNYSNMVTFLQIISSLNYDYCLPSGVLLNLDNFKPYKKVNE